MTPSFTRARAVVADAIEARVFPGAVVEVGRRDGVMTTWGAGHLTYDAAAPQVTPATVYDLASLTKVLATTTLAAMLAADGRLDVDAPVARFIPSWTGADRQGVTVRDLLEHCSGLPAHAPYYSSMSGREAFEHAIATTPLAHAPRTAAVYSDPGFILLGLIVEQVGGAALDAQFDRWRKESIGEEEEIRYGVAERWMPRVAPTETDASGRTLVGVVHDENARALGGVAGHAGLFGTGAAVGACARWWMGDDARLAPLLRKSAVAGSSRAMGWDTMLPTSSCGTRLSARAFGHTGFTGTSLWIDPGRDLYVVFLSNRVHPTRQGEGMQPARRALHDAVMADLEG